MLNRCLLLLLSCFTISLSAQNAVDTYGQLSVSGTKMVGANGTEVQLRGMSLFWSQWEGEFYVANTVEQLKTDWCTNIVRCAMAVESGGYLTNPNAEEQKVREVVEACIAKGMYVIIDWHDHAAHNHTAQAVEFFDKMSRDYGQYPNVIYEIYNEPLQVSWSNTIRPYSNTVIEAIRRNDPDNIIVCGTPNWSQDVDAAAQNPITGQTNIMYTLHYYAGTHKQSLRNKAITAMNAGLALFVTEFGNVNADGGGAVDQASSNEWFAFMNQYKLSYCNWSLCDKDEGSAVLRPGTTPNQTFSTRLTTSGTFMYNHFTSSCPVYSSPNLSPSVSLSAPSNNTNVCQNEVVIITANATDSDGTISKVEFYAQGNLLFTDESSPYSYDWTPNSTGSVTLTAIAYDNSNASSTSNGVGITINNLPNAPMVNSGSIAYCLNASASRLQATGQNLRWYANSNSTNSTNTAPTPNTSVSGEVSYFVSQTTNGCESEKTEIVVVVNEALAPSVIQEVNYCEGEQASQLTASGTNLKWYTQENGGNSNTLAPIPSTSGVGNATYYVSQTVNSCESPRAAIVVSVGAATQKPVVNSPVEYCQNSSAEVLTAEGSNLKWYNSQSGTGSLAAIVPVTSESGTINYYVSQTSNGCESERSLVAVVIKAAPDAPVVTRQINYSIDEQAVALSANGTNLLWYTTSNSLEGSISAPIPTTENVGETMYYVSQTIDGCESQKATISVMVINAITVGKTPLAPEIDGSIDEVWNKVTGKSLTNTVQGTVSNQDDLSATFKTLWDDTYFYVLGEITDDSKINDSQASYQDDAVEVFFDFGNDKVGTYGANDVQYTFGFGDAVASANNNKNTNGLDFVISETINGYVFEARFLWSSLGGNGVVGDLHGFEFEVNDDDNGNNRDGKLAWNATIDDAWENTSLFGTVQLGALISICEKPSVPTLSVSGNRICEGDVIDVTSNGANADSFQKQWYKDGVLLTDSTNAKLKVYESGLYSVKYFDLYEENQACYSMSTEALLTVNPLPVAPEIIGAPTACIYNPTEVYSYSVNDNSGSTFQWSVDNERILSGNGTARMVVEFAQSTATSTTIYVTETDRNNCTSVVSSRYVFFDCPNAIFNSKESQAVAFPNPFDSYISVEGYDSYEIFDLSGKKVAFGSIENELIKTENLAKSIYVLKLVNSDTYEVLKMTKE